MIRDETGEPWSVAKDIAGALGYADTAKAVKAHCKSARPVGVGVSPTLDPQTNVIPERDIYRLVMRSKLPSAEKGLSPQVRGRLKLSQEIERPLGPIPAGAGETTTR